MILDCIVSSVYVHVGEEVCQPRGACQRNYCYLLLFFSFFLGGGEGGGLMSEKKFVFTKEKHQASPEQKIFLGLVSINFGIKPRDPVFLRGQN